MDIKQKIKDYLKELFAVTDKQIKEEEDLGSEGIDHLVENFVVRVHNTDKKVYFQIKNKVDPFLKKVRKDKKKRWSTYISEAVKTEFEKNCKRLDVDMGPTIENLMVEFNKKYKEERK